MGTNSTMRKKGTGFFLYQTEQYLKTYLSAELAALNANPDPWNSGTVEDILFWYRSDRVSVDGYPNVQIMPDVASPTDVESMNTLHRVRATFEVVGPDEGELVARVLDYQEAALNVVVNNPSFADATLNVLADEDDFTELFILDDILKMSLSMFFTWVSPDMKRMMPFASM